MKKFTRQITLSNVCTKFEKSFWKTCFEIKIEIFWRKNTIAINFTFEKGLGEGGSRKEKTLKKNKN